VKKSGIKKVNLYKNIEILVGFLWFIKQVNWCGVVIHNVLRDYNIL
jgi:hypothetical protein